MSAPVAEGDAATRDPATPPSALARAYQKLRHTRFAELVRFGSVGALAYVVDVGIFNLLLHTSWSPLAHKPITVKVISAGIATVVAWLGNRYWTFAQHKTANPRRELVQFLVINIIGMGIAAGCLAISRYVLQLDSALADNISANVVGLILGTIFRYFAYKKFVFTAEK